MVVLLALIWGMSLGFCTGKNRERKVADAPLSIHFYTWVDEEPYMKKVIAAFEAKNRDIRVKPTFVPNSEYRQKLLIALSGGTHIDVFNQRSPADNVICVKKNQLIALDTLMKKHGYNSTGVQDLINQLKVEGRLYALPYRKSAWVLYYNKTIFDKAGIAYPDGTWTWEKYAKTAKLLTRGVGENKIWGTLNYQPTNIWWRVPALASGHNNPLKEADLVAFKRAAKLAFDLSYTLQAQQPYGDRVGTRGGDYIATFLQGKTAMFYNGDWAVEMLNRRIIQENICLDYDIALLPHWEGNASASTGAPAVISISKNTKKADAAFRFIQFVTGEAGANIIAQSGLIPAWNSNSVKREFLKNLQQPKNAKYFFTQKLYPQVPVVASYDNSMQIVTEEVSLYLVKEQNLDETFIKIKQRLRDEVK